MSSNVAYHLLTYNILNGALNDDRFGRLRMFFQATEAAKSLPEQSTYDFVALNECNGWHRNMPEFPRSLGFEFSTLLKCKTGYHIGFISRYPFEVTLSTSDAPFHHGLLEVRIQHAPLAFLVTHLSPRDSTVRANECAAIVQRCAQLEEDGIGAILLGDLNTLSPLDRQDHLNSNLATLFASDQNLARKFLNANGEIDYRPMETLLHGGLVDLAFQPDPSDGRVGRTPAPTVPTPLGGDAMHAHPMRLDYIMASPLALALVAGPARTLVSEATSILSDHYPVEATLSRWPGPPPPNKATAPPPPAEL